MDVKGNDRIIAKLNDLLADELTAISQYMVHTELCDHWGYDRLHEAIQKRAVDEMKHAERLIGRIVFLEGKPIVGELKPIHIGAEVPAQHENDRSAEEGAIKSYNDGIRLAVEVADNGSRQLMEAILRDEEAHIDWIEAQLDEIKQMGVQIYLGEQVGQMLPVYWPAAAWPIGRRAPGRVRRHHSGGGGGGDGGQ
jgi:bacterioferritin